MPALQGRSCQGKESEEEEEERGPLKSAKILPTRVDQAEHEGQKEGVRDSTCAEKRMGEWVATHCQHVWSTSSPPRWKNVSGEMAACPPRHPSTHTHPNARSQGSGDWHNHDSGDVIRTVITQTGRAESHHLTQPPVKDLGSGSQHSGHSEHARMPNTRGAREHPHTHQLAEHGLDCVEGHRVAVGVGDRGQGRVVTRPTPVGGAAQVGVPRAHTGGVARLRFNTHTHNDESNRVAKHNRAPSNLGRADNER